MIAQFASLLAACVSLCTSKQFGIWPVVLSDWHAFCTWILLVFGMNTCAPNAYKRTPNSRIRPNGIYRILSNGFFSPITLPTFVNVNKYAQVAICYLSGLSFAIGLKMRFMIASNGTWDWRCFTIRYVGADQTSIRNWVSVFVCAANVFGIFACLIIKHILIAMCLWNRI